MNSTTSPRLSVSSSILFLWLCLCIPLATIGCRDNTADYVVYYPDGGSAESSIIESFSVMPNPVSAKALVFVRLKSSCSVAFDVYGCDWHRLKVVDHGLLSAGEHELRVDLENIPSGSYYLMVRASGYAIVRPISVLH